MKKKFLKLMSILMVTIVCVGYVSCSDDDDDDAGIVGTWIDGNKTMQLGKDGSYYSYYGSNPTGSQSQYRKGTYSYNANQSLLTVNVTAVPNHNNAYKDTYVVQTLTSTTLVLVSIDDGSTGYFTRK